MNQPKSPSEDLSLASAEDDCKSVKVDEDDDKQQ